MEDVASQRPGLVAVLDEAFWVRWPAFLSKFSPTLSAAFSDGIYLSCSRWCGALFPIFALLLGLYMGWTKAFYSDTEGHITLTAAVLLLLLSQHSAALGAYAWFGYVLGDLHVFELELSAAQFSWASFGPALAARLLADTVMSVSPIVMPLAAACITEAFVRQYHARLVRHAGALPLAAALVRGLSTFAMIYFWLSASAVLTQAVFLWQGFGAHTHSWMQFWAGHRTLVAAVGAYAAAMRSLLVLHLQGQLAPRLAQLRAALVPAGSGFRVSAIVLRAAYLCLLCGSLIVSWTNAALLFAALAVLMALWTYASQYQLPWSGLHTRVPLGARAAIGLAVVYFFATQVVRVTWASATTFYSGQLVVLVALVVFCLLIPARGRLTSLPAPALEVPASVQAGIFLALCGVGLLTALWPDAAFAGTCGDLGNCASGQQPLVDDCMAGLGMMAGLCTAQKHGGQWQGNSDDFSGRGE